MRRRRFRAVWLLRAADAGTLAMPWQRSSSVVIGRLNWRHWLMRCRADA